MKMGLITAVLLLSTLSSAHAFSLSANCQFDQAHGECTVVNDTGRPIYCELRAQGVSSQGAWSNASIQGWLASGQDAYVNVYANNPYIDPLVNVSGSANCRF